MINWISSEDEKNINKVDFNNLIKMMEFLSKQDCEDEMINYVKEICKEYVDILKAKPLLLKDNLIKKYEGNICIDGDLTQSSVIVSSSDINSYYTIKGLNKDKKNLTIVCFDMHSDTYDYNDYLWKGNGFSKLLKENYISHYVVIGVPKHKRENCISDTNEELRNRVHLIDETDLFNVLKEIKPQNIFISIDIDVLNCRKSHYTAVEYSPATILNHISHIEKIDKDNYIEKIRNCVYVKNELGYSNYYHTGENDITVDDVIRIAYSLSHYCYDTGINLGLNNNDPYFQIMEANGYDYGNLTSKMMFKLIDKLSKKEVKKRWKSKNF